MHTLGYHVRAFPDARTCVVGESAINHFKRYIDVVTTNMAPKLAVLNVRRVITIRTLLFKTCFCRDLKMDDPWTLIFI